MVKETRLQKLQLYTPGLIYQWVAEHLFLNTPKNHCIRLAS